MRRCAGKNRHETKSGAAAERSSICAKAKIRTDKISVFRCDQCLGWHVGGSGNSFKTRTRTGRRPNKRMRGRV